MRKTAGPFTIIDTNPPYRGWDGNQATYLFFPTFISSLLVLIASLSDPIIHGLSIIDVDAHGNGTISFGAWGWCSHHISHHIPGVTDHCSSYGAFGSNMSSELAQLPESVQSFADISTAVSGSYLVASGIMHIFACVVVWLTTIWTLAASGSWNNKRQEAWEWTRWAFSGTFWSALLILIAWALDLGEITKVHSKVVSVGGTRPAVTPGPAIWMMMVAFLLNAITFIVRVSWLKFKPRPQWTIKGAGGDFHNASHPPMAVAMPLPDEKPPTWDSLSFHEPAMVDEKLELQQPGFAV